MISKRVQSIDASGIRKVFDLGAQLKDPINLSIGQPDFDAFPEIHSSLKNAVDSSKCGYTVTQGIEPLRDKIRAKYGIPAGGHDSDVDVFITSGVSGGLLLSYLALLDPGEEILMPDPFFCMYRDLATVLSAVPTYYDCYPDFNLPLEQIEAAITPRTKAILLNTPSNPTGCSIQEKELETVLSIAKAAGIWVLYDEIYESFSYDSPHVPCFGKYEKTLILSGFSKSHGIPGLRVGYAVGPKTLINQMLKVQQYSFVCSPSIAQWAMVDGIEIDLGPKVAEYSEKRDYIYEGLKGKFNVTKPAGAFYIFPEAPGGNAMSFVEKCIENNLLVIPGNVFSRRDTHFRISFAASLETLGRGIEVLNSLV